MYCTTCGKELPDGASVCDECQTSFSGDGQALPPGDETENRQADEMETEKQTEETEDGRRPYMNYRPFSSSYGSGSSEWEQTPENDRDPSGTNPYAQNPYWKRPYEDDNDFDPGRTGFAIASLVLGVIAICSCCLPIITIPLGILAIIFAVPGMKSMNRGIAVAGLILGIVALVLGMMMLLIILLSSGNGYRHAYHW